MRRGRCQARGPSLAERAASAVRFGNKLFIPALVIPAVVLAGTLALKGVKLGGVPLLEPKQETLISLAAGAILALAIALAMFRQPLSAPLQEGRRLMQLPIDAEIARAQQRDILALLITVRQQAESLAALAAERNELVDELDDIIGARLESA